MQRVGRKVAPEGTAMDDWRIAVELALRLGADFDLATVDEVTDEIARVAPAHSARPRRCCAARATASCCRCASTSTRSSLRTRDLSIMAEDGHGHVLGSDQGRGRGAGRLDRRGRGVGRRCRRASRRSRRPRRRSRRGRAAVEAAHAASATAVERRAGAARVGPHAPDANVAAPRRVRSAPRGRPHALRPRTHRRARRRSSRGLVPDAGAARSTRTTSPRSVSTPGTEVRVTGAAARRCTRRRRPTPRCRPASRSCRSRPTAPGRPSSSTSTRPSPTCAWRRCGERDARARPALRRRRRSRGRCSPSSLIKVVVAFVLLLVAVMLYIWGMRKVIADMQNRIGPNRAGPVRRPADARRRHQAVLQGAVDPVDRPTGPCSGSRRTCRSCRRS